MKTIILTRGMVALVDDDLYPHLVRFKWQALRHQKSFYAATRMPAKIGKKRKYVFMHSVIGRAPKGYVIDHKDRNRLNNQTENLRICTNLQNLQNSGFSNKQTASGFKGVYKARNSRRKPWGARIKQHYIGTFSTKEEAAAAYDAEAVRIFGEYACTNKMLGLIP